MSYDECIIVVENYAKYLNYIIDNNSKFTIYKYTEIIDSLIYIKNNYTYSDLKLLQYIDYLIEKMKDEKNLKIQKVVRKIKMQKIMNNNVTNN